MPRRIGNMFRELRARGEKAFIPFVMAGDPDLETTIHLVPELARAGSSVVELGVPFSDPIADGPVIQRAAARALGAEFAHDRVTGLELAGDRVVAVQAERDTD